MIMKMVMVVLAEDFGLIARSCEEVYRWIHS